MWSGERVSGACQRHGWLAGPYRAWDKWSNMFQETKMLRKLRTKWYLLVAGSSMTVALGQCVADILEDALIFNIVD